MHAYIHTQTQIHTHICTVGYWGSGESVCQDIDECANGTHNCANISVANYSCRNSLGSFTCPCLAGFALFGSAGCGNVDECALGTHSCGPHSFCNDTFGSFVCACHLPGYPMLADDQRDCVNVDECSLSVHDCHPKALCTGELANVCECRSDLYVLACTYEFIIIILTLPLYICDKCILWG
jgi:hypothetical protein